MILSKTLVVSNHANHDLEWLRLTYKYGFSPKNTIIYDRTPDDFPEKSKIDHLGKVIKSPNVGSNPYDIGRYIFDHYDNLPDMMIHIKGNLLQKKYTTEERFIYGLFPLMVEHCVILIFPNLSMTIGLHNQWNGKKELKVKNLKKLKI